MLGLAQREFRARYAGSALGTAWAVVEPAIQFALYLTVFAYFLGTRIEGRPSVGFFGLYLVTGLVPFAALQEAVVRAAGLARSQAGLVRHVPVPLAVLLSGSLLAVFARHAISLGIVALVAVAAGTVSFIQLPWLVAGVLVLLIASFGAGLALAVAGAYLPDLAQVAGTGTMMLFFLSPIVYPESSLPELARSALVLNPLVGVLDMFRAALLGSEPRLVPVAVSVSAAVMLALAGSWLARRRAGDVPDLV